VESSVLAISWGNSIDGLLTLRRFNTTGEGFPLMRLTPFQIFLIGVWLFSLDMYSRQVSGFAFLTVRRAFARRFLKLFKLSCVGLALSCLTVSLRSLLAVLQSSLNHGLEIFRGCGDVFGTVWLAISTSLVTKDSTGSLC
jgi:hypothetical protein